MPGKFKYAKMRGNVHDMQRYTNSSEHLYSISLATSIRGWKKYSNTYIIKYSYLPVVCVIQDTLKFHCYSNEARLRRDYVI